MLFHLRPACSLNKMCYTDKEMMLAARSLATKPVFTNHSPTMADGRMRSEGMVIHADWFPEKSEVVGVAALKGPNAKHLWDEIRMHGRAPISQRTHYFKSFKAGGFEYPEGIVFDEVSLIVDDENPGKPGDYVEALEAAQASMQYAAESFGFQGQYVSTDKVRKMKKEGVEQTTPPLAKLSPKVSFNRGRFAGPASPKQTIRAEGDEFATRYGQGYSEPPARSPTIDLPGEYGPPLNYARIRGGPGADIPFPAARVQMPGTGGQSAAEPTAKPHMKDTDEDAGDGLPQGSRGTTKRGNVGRPQGDQGYIKPVPTAAYTKPGASGGDEKINFDVPQKSPSLLGTPSTTPDRHLQAMPPRKSMSAPGGVGTAGLLSPLEQDADGEGDGEDDGDADAKKMRGQDADGEDDGDAETDGEGDGEQSEAVWTTKYINALPSKAFAMPKERKYPHHKKDGSLDRAHVMACSSYAAKMGEAAAKSHCDKHKQEMGIGEFAKTAQERLQWERYTASIEPLYVIEQALVELSREDESLNARIGGFIEEALNKEFNRSKMGEFMRMFGPRLVQMEMSIEQLKECASEMGTGAQTQKESAPATENIISGVIEGLTIRARQIANEPVRAEQLQGLMGRNVAVAYAKQVRTKALRDLGFTV